GEDELEMRELPSLSKASPRISSPPDRAWSLIGSAATLYLTIWKLQCLIG
ncbi:unnamed protein product, partial [Tetraodon nigroviridis]